MNSNAFAKGDALAKLIELIGADNKAFKAQDAELMASINEVREMFNTDELTVCSEDELVRIVNDGKLEPGHAYMIDDEGKLFDGVTLTNITVTAKTNDALQQFAISDDYLVHIDEYIADTGEGIHIFNIIKFDDLVKLVTEGSKDSFFGSNKIKGLSSVPVDKSTVEANLWQVGDQTLSWAEGLEDGREVLLIAHNLDETDINIILPDNCNEAVLTIPAGEYSEISVINVDGTYYTRVPSATSASGGTGEGPVYEEITAADVQAMFAGTYGS